MSSHTAKEAIVDAPYTLHCGGDGDDDDTANDQGNGPNADNDDVPTTSDAEDD